MKPLASIAIALGLSAAAAIPVSAHIVPPEEYHPVAEAHRVLSFVLNLNPIDWNIVEWETAKIEDAYTQFDPEAGAAYMSAIDDLLLALRTEAEISSPTPTMRIQTAQGVFEVSTRAVGDLIVRHLEYAESNLGDYDAAAKAFDGARQIFAAFEHEIKHSDPDAFRRLGAAWLEASSALGNPGLAGIGVVPADSEIFASSARTITNYLTENYGEDFDVEGMRRMAALPLHSASYDANAPVPPKLPPGFNLNKQLPRPRQLLNFAERGASESETALIAMGDMLFDSPFIFGEPARSLAISCNTCHNKGVTNPQFNIPGLSSTAGGMDVSNAFFAPHANNGIFDPIDIPDLRGIKFTAPYGRNGRIASLREFTRNVIVNEFNGPEPTPVMLDALVMYMNEFDFLPNEDIKPNGKLKDSAPEDAKRGEKIFYTSYAQMNHLSCADCHRPSSHFTDGLKHNIGSVANTDPYAMDGGIDTPTLLSSAYTAPYFHDGRLPTLRSVVDWFDETYSLGFTEQESADLTAFLKTIGGGVDSYEDTMFTLEAEMEEFSFFLSSYEFLRERGHHDIIDTMFRTIEQEIHAHKWDVQDARQMPILNELAGIMVTAQQANAAGDYAKVDEKVNTYRALYAQHAENLK